MSVFHYMLSKLFLGWFNFPVTILSVTEVIVSLSTIFRYLKVTITQITSISFYFSIELIRYILQELIDVTTISQELPYTSGRYICHYLMKTQIFLTLDFHSVSVRETNNEPFSVLLNFTLQFGIIPNSIVFFDNIKPFKQFIVWKFFTSLSVDYTK